MFVINKTQWLLTVKTIALLVSDLPPPQLFCAFAGMTHDHMASGQPGAPGLLNPSTVPMFEMFVIPFHLQTPAL